MRKQAIDPQSASADAPVSEVRPDLETTLPSGACEAAVEALQKLERLLLDPRPEAITAAAEHLTIAQNSLALLQSEASGLRSKEQKQIELLCRRIRILLGSAQKIQWQRIREMGPFLESYPSSAQESFKKSGVPQHLNVLV